MLFEPRLRSLIFLVAVALTTAAGIFAQESAPAPPSPDLGSARVAARDGRGRAAAALFDRVLADRPGDVDLLREAAGAVGRLRRFADAARYLVRVTELRPDDPIAWFDLGVCRFNQHRHDLALPALRRAVEGESRVPAMAASAEPRRLCAQSARELDLWAEALAEFRVAIERAPTDAVLRRQYGAAAFDSGDYATARAAFAEAVRLAPNDAEALRGLGRAEEETGDVEAGIRTLLRAREIDPKDVRIPFAIGQAWLRRRELVKAESFLTEAREKAPRSSDVLFALAQTVRLRGRAGEADRLRADAEKIKAGEDAAVERGRVFFRRLVTEPENAQAHLDYALDVLGRSDLETAERIFARLLSFAPETELALVNYAALLLRRGAAETAELEIRKLLERDPTHLPGRVVFGYVRLSRGDAAGAENAARQVLAVDAKRADANALMAEILRRTGRAEEAERYARPAGGG